MDTISSSFIPKFSQPIITPSSSFITFWPLNKLTPQCTTQRLTNIKKNPKSKQATSHKRNKHSPLEILFSSLDNFICNFLDLPLRRVVDPKHILSGIFAPADELPPTACQVIEGTLPSCLDGVYIRNGPNPRFRPRGPYHLFDGDGMLHSIKILNGKAKFCSRYVQTYKYKVESKMGYSVFPSYFSSFNGFSATMTRLILFAARILTGQIDISRGSGVAGTSLALFGGQIFALDESDLPYAIKVTPDGDLITFGRHDFNTSSKEFSKMTAHPKTDRITGETFAFTYNSTPPFLKYFRISPGGVKQSDLSIFSLERPSVIHDFAVTKNYAIFPEIQIYANPLGIMRGRSPVLCDPSKVPRLGIIPKYAADESEMWWIDAPGFNLVHVANAWEEDGGDTVVVVGSNISAIKYAFENPDFRLSTIEKIVINVREKTLHRYPLSTRVLELGCVNPAYSAKKARNEDKNKLNYFIGRYVYSFTVKPPEMLVGVVKLDLSIDCGDCVMASRLYESGCVGGEPIFVPKDPNNPGSEEDDGYIVTYVHDETSAESSFLVMDAKSPSLEIIAKVKLPHRVPCGFHGIFVSQRELDKLG